MSIFAIKNFLAKIILFYNILTIFLYMIKFKSNRFKTKNMCRKDFFKYIISAFIIILVVVFVWFFSSRSETVYVSPPPTVVVAYPQERTIKQSLILSGHVEARAMVPVVPLVSGTILNYPIKAGMKVAAGQVLTQIDQEAFRQQMLQAKAAYTGYESSFTRVSGLFSSGAASRQEYDTVKAQRDAAKAQYDLAELQLGYATVTSPITGTILSAPMSVGSVASPQQVLAVIADLSDLVVRLDVPEKYFDLFANNSLSLTAQIVRPGDSISKEVQCFATIDTVAPYIDGESKTFQVVLQLQDHLANFKPGMYVKAEVFFQSYENVLALPLAAKKSDDSCYLFHLEKQDSNEKSLGTVEHIQFDTVVSDDQWFMIPQEYSEQPFVIQGHGTIFNHQQVSATYSTGATQ